MGKTTPNSGIKKRGFWQMGVSAGSSVAPKKTKAIQGDWAQQSIWHSERHSQERRPFLQKHPSKTPLFLAPDTRAHQCLQFRFDYTYTYTLNRFLNWFPGCSRKCFLGPISWVSRKSVSLLARSQTPPHIKQAIQSHSGDYTYTLELFSNEFSENCTYTFIRSGEIDPVKLKGR